MLVFWKENLVLLAVPKTGSTALESALAPRASMVLRQPPHMKHTPYYRYDRFLRPFFAKAGGEAPEVMAIVRHPVAWLGSWYRYRTRDALIGHKNSTRGISFDDFIIEYCKDDPATFAAVGSQDKFLRTKDGEIGADHLFCYEDWDKVTTFLQDRLALTLALQRKNVSPAMDLVLSPDVLARLHTTRAAEFTIWETAQG
jgi:hypothetical protein